MAHVVSIRLRGFKSVGGEWLEVRLKSGLNAIVGPNGCGKSSMLEALCFAFAVPPRALGASSLSDLANSDCSKVRPGCCSHSSVGLGLSLAAACRMHGRSSAASVHAC